MPPGIRRGGANLVHTELPASNQEVKSWCDRYNFYVWAIQKSAKPLAVAGAKGCYFWDFEGNKYFDSSSELVNVNIGFGNEKVISAIKEQADRLCYISPFRVTDVRAALAKKIIEEIAPPHMGKVLFTLGGSDANENAIRIAKEYTGRTKVFSQYYSYHGATYGACNLNGEAARGSVEPPIAGFVKFFGFAGDYLKQKFETDKEYTEFLLNFLEKQIVQEGAEKVAAIFFESITGSNGGFIPPRDYYKGVRKICDKYGILMVCDEVMMGFGRTGKWFAFEHFDVKPDMITFAKGITSGYAPLGGVIVSKEIAAYFDEITYQSGLTCTAHPLSCAAALACIEEYQDKKLLQNAAKMGDILYAGLCALKKKHPSVDQVRGIGLMCTFNLHPPFVDDESLAVLFDEFLKRGFYVQAHDAIFQFAPPLIVTGEEINKLLKATDEVLSIADTMLKQS
ncbi:MAG: aminotransferase class III-fold pyridoxal phosphate-dependent enzyme [Firmicutes bacterium]|nr:aminotransferase class III-fold pyridoxal phosphate-dependent enzyme [Bacillota bacterium]